MTDWTHILDFDPSDNEEDDDSDNEDSDSGKPSDGEAGDGDLDGKKDFTTNLSEEDAISVQNRRQRGKILETNPTARSKLESNPDTLPK
ncbi:hypothetical protein ARMGADRAFT_1084748 [Armillaria gallica]|uniref:Uncharacterized protein n=1 Tax=Armillaria gallica TaxID=47427 RepID=A0A2H3DAG7_ARMGA|nr:hypothetical protein ARMGADRAFT_1084748 [Armillaria gallica]